MRSSNRKKPQRINPDWKLWLKRVRVFRRIIRDLKRQVSPHGQKWTDNMVRHFQRKLDIFMEAEPPKYIR